VCAEELGRENICVNRVSSKETEKRGCNIDEVEVELAMVVAWLVGEESRLVSGQNVTIGGGWGVFQVRFHRDSGSWGGG
jgi:hypothetical protein